MTEVDIYKAVHDVISDVDDWISNEKDSEKAIQYILGAHDLSVRLIEKLQEES